MAEGKHATPTDGNEAAGTEYRCEDYDKHAQPVERPTGEARPSEAVEHRSYDYDRLAGGAVLGTTTERAETKVVKPGDKSVGTK